MKTFAGIPEENATFENSRIVLQYVAYDGTTTWNKGSDKGPEAFAEAAENMELYDIITDTEVYKEGIYTSPLLSGFQSPEDMTTAVYDRVKEMLEKKKYMSLVGGEHSISIGSIRAFNEHYENLSVLQLDAHADLRPEYEGSACNHACALHEASVNTNLVQVGIRSMDISEKEYMDVNKVVFAHEIDYYNNWIDDVDNLLSQRIYLTIDLDVFSPGIMPSTGTPEPGGMEYYQVINLIRQIVQTKHIVGFDIVELSPNPSDPAPDFLAAKLYYQILSIIFKNHAHGL